MIVNFDDWGKAHDPRDKFMELKKINSEFKMTLFTIPTETTIEMIEWANKNKDWVELAQHGYSHHSNYECLNWTKEQCLGAIDKAFFLRAKGFKAPGWQISRGCYEACLERGMWVADQPWNQGNRPSGLRVYQVPGGGAYHGHTWDCGTNNGIYEDWDNLVKTIKNEKEFKLISEVVQ